MVLMSRTIAWGLSFFAGVALMVLELTASRAIAPILGSSLYTWTAVIGVVLAGLSIGAYLGGRYIDKHPSISALRNLFFLSGSAVILMIIIIPWVSLVALLPISIPILATGVAIILFFLPAGLLGAIQPMIVRLFTHDVGGLGQSYGSLSALWSLGSIVGVFLSGFFLIPIFGTTRTFLLVASILMLCGLVFVRRRIPPMLVVLLCALLIGNMSTRLGPSVLYAKDTRYFKAVVTEANIEPFGLSRILFLDLDTHSILRGTSTVPIYTDIVRLFSGSLTASSSTLVIGGGAYTMPNALASDTRAMVDVFEIDPEIPPIVERFFSIHPKISTTIGDARVLLHRSQRSYDIIIGDSFNSYLSVPWHLLTREWNDVVSTHLAEGGVYAVNIISARSGPRSALYASVARTLEESFPFVEAYAFGNKEEDVQNIVFLASKKDLSTWNERARATQVLPGTSQTFDHYRLSSLPTDGLLLTDDHAPTDTQLIPVAEKSLPYSVGLYWTLVDRS
jgi:spermidine synthase